MYNIFVEHYETMRPRHWSRVVCTVCKAKVGNLCTTPKGRGKFGRPHKTRVKLARSTPCPSDS